jgi:hypothetical protein
MKNMRRTEPIQFKWLSLLPIIIALLVAGCLGDEVEVEPLDINISNLTAGTLTVDIVLVDEEGYTVYDESITLGSNTSQRIDDIVKTNSVYDLTITLSDGRSKLAQVGVGTHLGVVGVNINDDSIIIGQKVS